MATTYWLDDSNVDTTCDDGVNPRDMDKVFGSANTVTFSTSLSIMGDRGAFAINVGGDRPGTGSGSHTISVDVSANSGIGNAELVLRAIDPAGCTIDASTSVMTISGTGVQSFTRSLVWGATSSILWLAVRLQFTGMAMGTKSITIRTNDVDSFVISPWPVPRPRRAVIV
jgi:hypothetical protein